MIRRAASRSARLLYESSRPPSWFDAREQVLAASRPPRSTRRVWCGFSPYARSAILRNVSVSCSGKYCVLGEPARDRRVVGGGDRERLGRERAARLGESPPSASSASTGSYCSGRQTGATCAKFLAAPRSSDGPPTSIISMMSASSTPSRAGERGERVEVHADEVERDDPVLAERRRGPPRVGPREDAGVDAPGGASSRARRASRAPPSRPRPASPRALLLEERRPCRRRRRARSRARRGPRANVVDAVLVVDGDQRPHRTLPAARQRPTTTSGSSRCSTAWSRSSSVSRGSTGTGSCAQDRAGVDALVDEVHRDARSSRRPRRARPRSGGRPGRPGAARGGR